MKAIFGALGESAAGLCMDSLDRKLALGVIRRLTASGKYMSGLLKDAEKAGVGVKLRSWMGTRSEPPAEFTVEDINALMGPAVAELATETQSPRDVVGARLTRLVPRIAQQVVPFGEVGSPEVERVGLEALRTNILAANQ